METDFLSFVEHKRRYFEECLEPNNTDKCMYGNIFFCFIRRKKVMHVWWRVKVTDGQNQLMERRLCHSRWDETSLTDFRQTSHTYETHFKHVLHDSLNFHPSSVISVQSSESVFKYELYTKLWSYVTAQQCVRCMHTFRSLIDRLQNISQKCNFSKICSWSSKIDWILSSHQ